MSASKTRSDDFSTFTKRLIRLQEGTRWQRYVAGKVIPYLNRYDPNHVPVKG